MLNAELSPAAIKVAFWMVEHMNSETGIAYPSVQTLANLSGLKPRAIQGARAERGYISPVDNAGGRTKAAPYAIELERMQICASVPNLAVAMRMFGKRVQFDGGKAALENQKGARKLQYTPHNNAPESTESNPLQKPTSGIQEDTDAMQLTRWFSRRRSDYFPHDKDLDIERCQKAIKNLLRIADGNVNRLQEEIESGFKRLLASKKYPPPDTPNFIAPSLHAAMGKTYQPKKRQRFNNTVHGSLRNLTRMCGAAAHKIQGFQQFSDLEIVFLVIV